MPRVISHVVHTLGASISGRDFEAQRSFSVTPLSLSDPAVRTSQPKLTTIAYSDERCFRNCLILFLL